MVHVQSAVVTSILTVSLYALASVGGSAPLGLPISVRVPGGNSSSTSGLPTAGAVPLPGGFNAGHIMLDESDALLDRDLSSIRASGARWLRVDVTWAAVQTSPRTYLWTKTDRLMRHAAGAGLRVIALVTSTPAWARPTGSSWATPPDDPQTYAEFAARVAKRYKNTNLDALEVWNEPNLKASWSTGPQPARYAALLRSTFVAVKRVAPKTLILAGGLAGGPDKADGSEMSMYRFLETLYYLGAAGSFDAVAVHPYSYPLLPLEAGPGNDFVALPRMRQLMERNGDAAKQIWVTEYGAPTSGGRRAVGLARQAAMARAAAVATTVWTWAGPLIWYSFKDRGADKSVAEDNFGIVTVLGIAKPALAALTSVWAGTSAGAPPRR